jgi:hypothetical protein
MKHKLYTNTPLSEVELPKEKNVWPEPESGVNICLYKIKNSSLSKDDILFSNVTVEDLTKVLKSAVGFIDYTKFEYGEDFGQD